LCCFLFHIQSLGTPAYRQNRLKGKRTNDTTAQ
jgi:hypothetical protein